MANGRQSASHGWRDSGSSIRNRFSNADPEHSVDGRFADAGRSSLVPMMIFVFLAVLLVLVYADFAP